MPLTNYGLPRFRKCEFSAKFPFALISLQDDTMPVDVEIRGYSPFIPGNADDSSLPAASVCYTLRNKTGQKFSGVFYFSAMQFMGLPDGEESLFLRPVENGFVMEQREFGGKPETYGAFSVTTSDPRAVINTDFYRCNMNFDRSMFNTLTMRWNTIQAGKISGSAAADHRSPGGAIEIPFKTEAGGEETITIHLNWYVPHSALRCGSDAPEEGEACTTYQPWYAGRYASVDEAAADYGKRHDGLLQRQRNSAIPSMRRIFPNPSSMPSHRIW